MVCWTHSLRAKVDILRIDFVAELDGRLLGIKIKDRRSIVATLAFTWSSPPNTRRGLSGRTSPMCLRNGSAVRSKPVFIPKKLTGTHRRLQDHAYAASRLTGPANVGFVTRERRGLCLRCAPSSSGPNGAVTIRAC